MLADDDVIDPETGEIYLNSGAEFSKEIVDKVMANLSERVRATLTEEMELLSSFPPAKVDEARKEIANVIRLQDKDGTLQWIQ